MPLTKGPPFEIICRLFRSVNFDGFAVARYAQMYKRKPKIVIK
ncbi:hypothetical protein Cycma_1967 [Cyclobacterium marinum DSM 745]|uniref:Uncharacterized protein n=1 Tax=Cyclobacterium marinum (strain ATCC 25205 / DSM 745 / LMG 13164 / NCIMB 1802) TaxID=880070 RepID=G0IZQ0_CYCMS|nr:hypothetical protein Cycma_1967 [Cyclobacterium marinum DSM 745]